MPVVLLCWMAVIFALFYYHDKNIIGGAAYETAIVGSEEWRWQKEIEDGNYDEIIDYILSAYSEGLNIFYKEGVKSFFEEFAKTNDKNLHAIIGILDSQRETITNLNKKIKTQEERINKLEQEIEAISKKI